MPNTAIALNTGLFSSTAYPFTITIGGLEIAQRLIDFPSIWLEDTADDQDNGRAFLRYWDTDNSRPAREQSVVQIYDDTIDRAIFLGFVQKPRYEARTRGRWVNVECVGIGSLLDATVVPWARRPGGESTRTRFGYFWGYYARKPLAGDISLVSNVSSSLPADDFINVTLRQAIRQVAEQSGSSVRFYVDAVGRPHIFSGSEADPGSAPFNINIAQTPGGGEIAPSDFSAERDGVIKNRFYVRGANAAGSGFYQDDASVGQYGPREDFLDAPSADTAAKARSVAQLQLGRSAQPNVRGSFSAQYPNDGWRAGQNITITAAQHELSGFATRIVKVTTTFTRGDARRKYVIEFANRGAKLGALPSASGVSIGIPAQVTSGTFTDQDRNPVLSSIQGSTAAIGPALRRFIMTGVFNGDFALPPSAPSGDISADNPLPFWTFTRASGTANDANSDTDSASASGRVVTFALREGAANDDAYLEQIIPVSGARGRSYMYEAAASFLTGTSVNSIEVYVTAQYLKADATTTTGSAATSALTTTSIGASTLQDVSARAADEGQVPSDAYWLRVRIGLRRGSAATTDTVSVKLTEARLGTGTTQLFAVEQVNPATYDPAKLYQQSGSLFINPGGSTPRVDLAGSSGVIALNVHGDTGVELNATSGQPPYVQFQERTDPAAPSTNRGRLYVRDNGSGKSQLVIRFPTGAIQVLATEP